MTTTCRGYLSEVNTPLQEFKLTPVFLSVEQRREIIAWPPRSCWRKAIGSSTKQSGCHRPARGSVQRGNLDAGQQRRLSNKSWPCQLAATRLDKAAFPELIGIEPGWPGTLPGTGRAPDGVRRSRNALDGEAAAGSSRTHPAVLWPVLNSIPGSLSQFQNHIVVSIACAGPLVRGSDEVARMNSQGGIPRQAMKAPA